MVPDKYLRPSTARLGDLPGRGKPRLLPTILCPCKDLEETQTHCFAMEMDLDSAEEDQV